MTSPVASRTPAVCGVIDNDPSRSPAKKLSAAWAILSSFAKPRNPQVPLIVCIVRKMLASTSRE